MFCLRSWLPLLFIPTNASPAFIFLFFVCTYFLNRPCVYCSLLLLILFFTSCNWSDRCFFDFSSDWFNPRPSSAFTDAADMVNTTVKGLAGAATEEAKSKGAEWTGLGVEWLRSLLGKREWSIDCLEVKIRL